MRTSDILQTFGEDIKKQCNIIVTDTEHTADVVAEVNTSTPAIATVRSVTEHIVTPNYLANVTIVICGTSRKTHQQAKRRHCVDANRQCGGADDKE